MAKKDRDVVSVRTMFLSDIHLGTKGCQAEMLLGFLKHYEADTIYLVGDIIDGWRLRSSWYWPQTHNNVVQKLLKRARKGTRVVYIPGNHDEFARDYVGDNFGGIEIMGTAIHEGLDGNRLLIIHGDHFDLVVRHAPWLAYIGDGAYTLALAINRYLNIVRRRMGLAYWSLSSWAKYKVKKAVNHIGRFEELLSNEARRLDVQGVVCGHIHHATMHNDFGVSYMNTGDWVESCTALVENHDGSYEIIRWADELRQLAFVERAAMLAPQAEASAA